MAVRKPAPDPSEQEQLVQRHPFGADPTSLDLERTSDNSTVENGGVGSGAKEDPAMPEDDATPQKTNR